MTVIGRLNTSIFDRAAVAIMWLPVSSLVVTSGQANVVSIVLYAKIISVDGGVYFQRI